MKTWKISSCAINLNYFNFIDRAMQLDKKRAADYVGTMEATIEIQSLQIVGFLSMVSPKCIRVFNEANKNNVLNQLNDKNA